MAKKPSKKQLKAIEELNQLLQLEDPEAAHALADQIILGLINNDEVKQQYHKIKKWYA